MGLAIVRHKKLRESTIITRGANLHVSPSPIVNAGRIFKETKSIVDAGLFEEVIVCGTANTALPRVEALDKYRRIERVGRVEQFRPRTVIGRIANQIAWSIAVYRRYSQTDLAFVNAHSVAVLPVCYLLSRKLGAALIYDTHELETETIASRGVQGRIFKFLERRLIDRCDAVLVVNQSISQWYAKQYPGLRPVVVRNIPVVQEARRVESLRDTLDVPDTSLLFIHVGHITAGRSVEAILDAFSDAATRHHVVFLGGGILSPAVETSASTHANIHHIPAVTPNEVVGYAATADVGLCLIEPSCLSYKLSLPNKAMEYISAGLPFFFSDLPEVSALLGPLHDPWMVPEPKGGLVAAIEAVTAEQIAEARASISGMRLPSWEAEAAEMIGVYDSILGSRTHP